MTARKSWFVSRRTFLRGAGACIGLPLLDAMAPGKARADSAPQRLLLVWHPNGIPYWKDPTPGAPLGRTAVPDPLAPGSVIPRELVAELAPVADYVSYIEKLSVGHYKSRNRSAADHCGFVSFYTGKVAGRDPRKMGTSLDQVIARAAPRARGMMTDIAVVPALREGQKGTPAIMMNAASWRGPGDPVLPITSPAALFKKVFSSLGHGPRLDPAAERLERERLTKGRLILDVVKNDLASLERRLGRDDRHKLDQYLTGVEELDRKTTRILSGEKVPLACGEVGPSPPEMTDDLMYVAKVAAFQDLAVKIFECDVARVMTFMHGPVAGFGLPSFEKILPGLQVSHEGATYRKSGFWHPLSHHYAPYAGMVPSQEINRDNFRKVVRWQYGLFGSLASKMKSTLTAGGENLLDSSLVCWGSGISLGASHFASNLHHVLVGKGGGAFKTKGHVMGKNRSLMDLWLTVLQGFGMEAERYGEDSTGIIPGILA